MKPIKVLMLVPNLRVANGVASFAISYYRKLDHTKVKMDFITYKRIESPYITEIKESGDSVFFIKPVKDIFGHYKDCVKIIKNGDYDIIHDNSLLITLPLMLASIGKVPFRVLHSHSTMLGESKRREYRNRLFLPLLLAVSNCYAACSFEAGKSMFGKRTFKVIPDVIDINRFKYRTDVRLTVRKREKCNDKYVIITVGRITHAKNPFFAIDVMEQFIKRHPDVEYWWIGSGELDRELDQYITRKKLNSKIRLFGSRSDVDELYQAADLFFMPSTSEGFGLACVEAETAGLECIVSDRLPKDVDVTGNVNFISLNKNLNEWVQAIERARETSIDRTAQYIKVAKSDFSDWNAGDRLLSYYNSL